MRKSLLSMSIVLILVISCFSVSFASFEAKSLNIEDHALKLLEKKIKPVIEDDFIKTSLEPDFYR